MATPSAPAASDPRVTAAAEGHQTPRQAAASATTQTTQATTPAPVYFHPPPRPAATNVQLPIRPTPSMVLEAAVGIT